MDQAGASPIGEDELAAAAKPPPVAGRPIDRDRDPRRLLDGAGYLGDSAPRDPDPGTGLDGASGTETRAQRVDRWSSMYEEGEASTKSGLTYLSDAVVLSAILIIAVILSLRAPGVICLLGLAAIAALILYLVGFYKIHEGRWALGDPHAQSVESALWALAAAMAISICAGVVSAVLVPSATAEIISNRASLLKLAPLMLLMAGMQIAAASLAALSFWFALRHLLEGAFVWLLAFACLFFVICAVATAVSQFNAFIDAAPQIDYAVAKGDVSLLAAATHDLTMRQWLASLPTVIPLTFIVLACRIARARVADLVDEHRWPERYDPDRETL